MKTLLKHELSFPLSWVSLKKSTALATKEANFAHLPKDYVTCLYWIVKVLAHAKQSGKPGSDDCSVRRADIIEKKSQTQLTVTGNT